MTLPAEYFDGMYARSADPWKFRTRWYEKRKHAVTMAALPRQRYQRTFEPGCSTGVLTELLASRSDRVVAADVSKVVVAAAAAALVDQPHVEVRRMKVPDEWPEGAFDLVVLSEIGYYFDPAAMNRLADRAVATLTDGGTLLVCHWRHAVADYPATGDQVHALFATHRGLRPAAHHVEEDFVLDVWTRGPVASVARAEGLV